MASVGLRSPGAAARGMFDGQSANHVPGDGYGGYTNPKQSFPYRAMSGLRIPFQVLAVQGEPWSELAASVSSRVYPQAGHADFTFAVLTGGTNSILDGEGALAGDGLDGQGAFDELVAYADGLRSAGFDAVIACSMTPLNFDGHFTPTEETARQDYNALILNDAAEDFDAVVNLHAAPLHDPDDLTRFFDHIHYSPLAAAEVGLRVRAAILEILP